MFWISRSINSCLWNANPRRLIYISDMYQSGTHKYQCLSFSFVKRNSCYTDTNSLIHITDIYGVSWNANFVYTNIYHWYISLILFHETGPWSTIKWRSLVLFFSQTYEGLHAVQAVYNITDTTAYMHVDDANAREIHASHVMSLFPSSSNVFIHFW